MAKDSEITSDIMDEALESYLITDDYKKQQHEVNEKLAAFKQQLGPALIPDFLELIDMITNLDTKFAEMTFQSGFECRSASKSEEQLNIE